MDNPENKSIRKSIVKVGKNVGNTIRSLLPPYYIGNPFAPKRFEQKPVGNTNRPKEKSPDRYYGMKRRNSQRGGKKGGKKTKRNMRKRGTQKRR